MPTRLAAMSFDGFGVPHPHKVPDIVPPQFVALAAEARGRVRSLTGLNRERRFEQLFDLNH
jgi:hypothetical protein